MGAIATDAGSGDEGTGAAKASASSADSPEVKWASSIQLDAAQDDAEGWRASASMWFNSAADLHTHNHHYTAVGSPLRVGCVRADLRACLILCVCVCA